MTAQNVLGFVSKPVYLNDPMNAPSVNEEENTNPDELHNPSEHGTPTSREEVEILKKRYADLQSHRDKKIAALESTINELNTQLHTKTSAQFAESAPKMPKTPEEWKSFEKQYPELAAQITTGAALVYNSSSSLLNEKMKQLEEIQNAIRAREGVEQLKRYHPDFEEIKDDPRFQTWFIEQPQKVQDLIRSSDPRTIAKGLDMFKTETGIGQTSAKKAAAKKDATRDVNTPGRVELGEGRKRTYSESEIWKMSMSEFEKNKDDILLAQREGRITKS